MAMAAGTLEKRLLRGEGGAVVAISALFPQTHSVLTTEIMHRQW